MGQTIKNATNAGLNMEANETGVEMETLSARYFPEYKIPFLSYLNQTTGFGVPDKLSVEVSLTAKVKGSTGLMAMTHTTAIVLSNDDDTFQASPGGLYMNEVTESQGIGEWRKISASLRSDPECA